MGKILHIENIAQKKEKLVQLCCEHYMMMTNVF